MNQTEAIRMLDELRKAVETDKSGGGAGADKAAPSEGKKTFGQVKPEAIQYDQRFQPRYKGAKNKDGSPKMFDQETVDKWRDAGKQAGYESGWNPMASEPVELYRDPKDGKLYVMAGFHRTALAQQTGQGKIDALVYEGITEDEAIDIAKRSNSRSKPQTPMDDAIMFRSDADAGMSVPQINAKYDQRGEGLIRRRILLTYLSPGMQSDVRNAPDTMIPYFEHIGLAAKAGASPSVQSQLYKHALNADSSAAQFRQMCVTVAAKLKEGGGKYKNADLGDMFGGADEGMKAFTAAVEQAKRDKKTLDALNSAHNSVGRLVAMMHESGQEVPAVYKAMLEQAAGDRDKFLKELAERKSGAADKQDDEDDDTGAKYEFGHHVHADGKSGIYLKDMGDGDHYVYTGKGKNGVEMVNEKKIKHAPEGHKPHQSVVEGAHKHPVARSVIEIGPKGGKRVAWYMGKDGKKKYEYQGSQDVSKGVAYDEDPGTDEGSRPVGEVLAGGLGDGANLSDFDPTELAMGLAVEEEHTPDIQARLEIVADHLTEDPAYYSKLAKMEAEG